jgi:arylsulfatase A-like enzyme
MVVDSFDPHKPWVPPRRYRELYGDPDRPFIGIVTYGPADRLEADEIDRLALTYKASVSLVDAQLGKLLDELDRLGLEETTTVMLVSDHGILVGDRDWVGKSAWLLNPGLIHVPLIVRHPDADGGVESDWLATTSDVPPTLMSLAGLTPPRRFEGADLSPIVHGGSPPFERELAYGGYSNDFYVRDNRWALISDNRMAGAKLYDLGADPGERDDISADHPDRVDELRRRLLAELPEPPRFYGPEQLEREPRRLSG